MHSCIHSFAFTPDQDVLLSSVSCRCVNPHMGALRQYREIELIHVRGHKL